MKASVKAFVGATMAAAAGMFVLLYMLAPHADLQLAGGSATLVLLGLLGSQAPYKIRGSTAGEVSFIPYLSAIVLYPSWATASMIIAAIVITELRKPSAVIKKFFNTAQTAFVASSAAVVYTQSGGIPLLLNSKLQLIPHSLAVILYLLLNTLLVASVVSLAEQKNVLVTWWNNVKASLAYDLVAIPVIYVFARVYVDWNVWGVLVLAMLVIGVRLTYRTKVQLELTNKELLELFVQTVEFRDPYTSGHSQRVSKYSRIIARAVGLPNKTVDRVSVAALLHDVGKIHEVFAPILSKPGRLTPEERAIMELHPIKSAELVARISDLQDIIPAVRHHHENWDGTGYPDQIAGKEIPLASRIIMFADTIDAMTTDRPYRKAMGEQEVRSELMRMRGRQFDPDICDALLESPMYPLLFSPEDSSRSAGITQVLDFARRKRTPAVA